MIIASLRYLWWGMCIGGRHYTGEVHHPNGTIELIRKLSRKEAKYLAQKDDSFFWADETNRFDTLQELEAAALKWCKDNLGDKWLLLHHDTLNPNHVVGGKGYTKKRLDQIERFQKRWWSLSDSVRQKKWNESYKKWYKLIEPDL